MTQVRKKTKSTHKKWVFQHEIFKTDVSAFQKDVLSPENIILYILNTSVTNKPNPVDR